jgi:serine/threonine protein kinase
MVASCETHGEAGEGPQPPAATLIRSAAPLSATSTASAANVTLGMVLSSRYRLDELLGVGGMGLVFRAADLQMPGVHVAIKVLKPEFRQQPELLHILRESVRKVRSLPHPNIASVYSLDADGESDFVIMELLQGQTLQELLDGEYARGMPVEMARKLIGDLCSALAYAHDHGVIHSDIKPANIFVTPSGRAKLFDFDIARVLRGPAGYFDAAQVGALTLAYASAEMEDGQRPDPRDDVYSLACVIYEMLSGKHPFGGASASGARNSGLQLKPLPGLRRRESYALSRALSFNREERLASVEALRGVFGGGVRPDRSGLQSLPLAVVAGAAAAFALCIILVWWFLRSSPTPHPQPRPSDAATALNRARSLAMQATALSVDQHDEALRRALALLAAGGQNEDPDRVIQRAQAATAALQSAIAHALRVARLGTTEPQLQEALSLCRQLGLENQGCSASNLSDETPRSVALRPFALDPAPVTNSEFARFVQSTAYRTAAETKGVLYSPNPRGYLEALRGQSWRTLSAAAAARGEITDVLPVLGVDLESARAYCRWKGERLPTEDEWEYSARGPSGQLFPWGDQPEPATPLPRSVTAVTESVTAGKPGAQGLGGNVAEWTEPRIAGQRVLRGGSWLLPQPYFQRLALRRLAPTGGVLDGSFRCAASAESWPGALDSHS